MHGEQVLRLPAEHPETILTADQIRSLTPSTTWAVVDLRASQVFSPACLTVLMPPFAARSPFRAFRLRVVVLRALDFVRPLDAAFRVGRFLVEARFAELRFLPAVRLVDFLVAAIWSLDRRLTGGQRDPSRLEPLKSRAGGCPAVAQITQCGVCHRHNGPVDLSLASSGAVPPAPRRTSGSKF
jgi:hypothetical protein